MKPECSSLVHLNPVNIVLLLLTTLRDMQSLPDPTLALTPDSPTSSPGCQNHGLGNPGRGAADAYARSFVDNGPEPRSWAQIGLGFKLRNQVPFALSPL